MRFAGFRSMHRQGQPGRVNQRVAELPVARVTNLVQTGSAGHCGTVR